MVVKILYSLWVNFGESVDFCRCFVFLLFWIHGYLLVWFFFYLLWECSLHVANVISILSALKFEMTHSLWRISKDRCEPCAKSEKNFLSHSMSVALRYLLNSKGAASSIHILTLSVGTRHDQVDLNRANSSNWRSQLLTYCGPSWRALVCGVSIANWSVLLSQAHFLLEVKWTLWFIYQLCAI